MLFQFNQPVDHFWQAIERLKILLSRFAKLSVVDSQLEKDEFRRECHRNLKQLDKDSINGGCYLENQAELVFSCEHNALLADFYLAAGQTFFDGEFSYFAKRQLTAICQLNQLNQSPGIFESFSYSKQTAPFCISGQAIRNSFDIKQLDLLSALIDQSTIESNQNYWINYRNSLQKAAEMAAIHYKQAQILEQEIHTKLIALSAPQYTAFDNLKPTNTVVDAQVLSTMVRAVLWGQMELFRDEVENIKQQLNLWLKADNTADLKKTILVCSVLIEYCQINYQPQLLSLIKQKVMALKGCFPKDEKVKLKLYECLLILQKLGFSCDSPEEYIDLPSLSTIRMKDTLNLVILPDSGAELEKQKLLSCYDTALRLFLRAH